MIGFMEKKKFVRGVFYTILTFFILGLVLLAFIYKELDNIFDTIFPTRALVFNSDTELVYIETQNTKYKLPKAYLSSASHIKGGEMSSFRITASLSNNMEPWTLSDPHIKGDKNDKITVTIWGKNSETDSHSFVERKVIYNRRLYEETYNGRYGDHNYGEYKSIFTRYNGERYNKKLIQFYLVPTIKLQKNYWIKCPVGSPDRVLCSVETFHKNGVFYQFMIPLRIVEKFQEYDSHVQRFISKIIIN